MSNCWLRVIPGLRHELALIVWAGYLLAGKTDSALETIDMAVDWTTALNLEAQGLFRPGTTVLDIGSSNVYNADGDSLAAFVARHTGDTAEMDTAFLADFAVRSRPGEDGAQRNLAFLGEILLAAGFGYESVDIADGFRTTLLDLNKAVAPSTFAQNFDLVLNIGTSEHILNQENVFRFVHDCTTVDGLMFHQLPASGFSNHGYFCYTARLFCDMAAYNGYDIKALWFDGPTQSANLHGAVEAYRSRFAALDKLLANADANARDKRAIETLIPEMSINVLYRKTQDTGFVGTLEMSTSVGNINPDMVGNYQATRRAGAGIVFKSHPLVKRVLNRFRRS